MATFALMPHPNHPPLGVRGVAVDVTGGRDDLRLTFRVDGADQLVWPAPAPPARTDELWRTTCFELFLMFDDEEHYVEFNFSPSTRWAAYAFDGYREGMADLPRVRDPLVERLPDGVAVRCDLSDLPHGDLAMSLSAVIEEEGGRKSFWALAHPVDREDFHHPGCFVARLPAGGAA